MSEPEPAGETGTVTAPKKSDGETDKKSTVPTYGLIRFTDMPEDNIPDILDLITGIVERYVSDIQTACKGIKDGMERTYGAGWQVIVGEQFGFDVSYQTHHLLYLFFGGNLGILVWKCS